MSKRLELEVLGHLEFRCCMCPNTGKNSDVCPVGPFKINKTPCLFVKAYIDDRGWIYKVMSGIGLSAYKARYRKPGETYKCMANLPWRDTFDEAQSDLNRMANKKGWDEA